MSLERKDIRAKLDHEAHAKLRAICDAEGVDMGEWIEQQLLPVIERKVHAAMMLTDALQRQGITGNPSWEKPGAPGK